MSKAGPYRLASFPAAAAMEFRFDGRTFAGVEGDTVASALLANGIRVFGRSFKFHRPRGLFSAGFEEPNALLQIGSGAEAIPSARATLSSLSPHLEVFSQSGWPSVSFDVLRGIDFAHRVFAAGFYNKTFIRPSWRFYESVIRKLAGPGKVPSGADPDRYETQHADVDVLVVGGGSAGVDAAMRAGAGGMRVMLVDMNTTVSAHPTELNRKPTVRVLCRTTAVSYYDHDLIALVEIVRRSSARQPRERLWLVRAKKVVLATGAIEQPMIFSNNDRPGVMLAGSALTLLRRHGIAPGRRVIVATNNDSGWAVAREMQQAGVNIVALVDSRARSLDQAPEGVAASLRVLGTAMPVDTSGFGVLKQVSIGHWDSQHRISQVEKIPCDALLVSGGFSPTLDLFAQAGGKLAYSKELGGLAPVTSHPSIDIVGMQEAQELGPRISPVGNPARQWVDLRHDVTVADIQLAVRENYRSIEHIKRYTTLGMSSDQGKAGRATAAEVTAKTLDIELADLGHTTLRPPFVPVTLGTLVGRSVGEFFRPIRRTPLHALQFSDGALFDDFGEWKRAAAFPKPGESRVQAMHREVQLVRNGLGLYDASPLGKIELIGPDALDFADRFYINNILNLRPGRARYGIMLRDTGIVFDDGTVTVLGEEHVLLTTTSSGAKSVYQWLEEWRQCEWPRSRVVVVPVTEQWATIALSGQHARDALKRLKPELDLSNEGFPHLGVRVTKLLGTQARIYRVSFSGELTYEINVPAQKGSELWSALLQEGRFFGIKPYGVDALLHLRMEKGFLHVGADTDGTTVPDDIGWGKTASQKQRHYVGKRSLTLPAHMRPDRLQLIGLQGKGALPVGSHLRLPHGAAPTDGWVTSAGMLSTNGTPIGLAVLRAGRSQLGRAVDVYDAGRVVGKANVIAPPFYDPTGARMNG